LTATADVASESLKILKATSDVATASL
jgi:hypothetical protein